MIYVSTLEILIYICAWISAVSYSMYQFHKTANRYTKYFENDLVGGWSWVGRKVDTSDYEWNVWSPILLKWLCYVVPFIVFSTILKRILPNFVTLTSIALSFCWLYSLLGLPLTVFIYTQPMLLLFISKLSSIIVVWIVVLSFTLGLHLSVFNELKLSIFGEDNHQEYFFAVLLAWTQARSISYLTDTQRLSSVAKSAKNLYHYCFYLPVLPSGPLVLYREFDASMKSIEQNQRIDWNAFIRNFIKLSRYFFWWGFNQFALHFFYHSAIQYHPNLVRRLDVWSAGGLGYALGQFFMLKYVVLYGVPSALANLDEIDAPQAPKCVGRIHLYSQMWRDFDRGLYNFMLNYIYIPFKGSDGDITRKLGASALCFAFVCIWHGAFPAVIIWCVSNYLGICIEALGTHLSSLEPIAAWKGKWSPANWRRFQAAAASPLLLMSALSNFCFFTDVTVGFILARKVFEGGWQRLLFILGAMYCCCQVSMTIGRRGQEKKQHKYVLRSLDD